MRPYRDPEARQRRLDERVERLTAFASAVAALPPESWDRMYARCAHLDGPSFQSLLDRAALTARSHQLSVSGLVADKSVTLLAIAGASRVVQTALAIAGQLASEFDMPAQAAVNPPLRRTKSTGRPRMDAQIDAYFLIESVVGPMETAHPGVVAAVRAAKDAVMGHDWLAPQDFDAIYGYIEPEIPFATLQPPSADATTS